MQGELGFYDDRSAWGLIMGEDGRVYVVRGAQIASPPPRVGEPVTFDPVNTGRGLCAISVRRSA